MEERIILARIIKVDASSFTEEGNVILKRMSKKADPDVFGLFVVLLYIYIVCVYTHTLLWINACMYAHIQGWKHAHTVYAPVHR